MRILGIHDGHNAAACLLEDGRVRAAVQEERLSRIKNHDIFPKMAISAVLAEAGCALADLDGIALNGHHMPAHRDRRGLIDAVRKGENSLTRPLRGLAPALATWKAIRRRERMDEAAAAGIDFATLHEIEHHACHAEAAYWGSPWRGERVLVLTCDGAGDDLCATVSIADEQGGLKLIAKVHESHSPAMIYLATTTLLGMVPNEHEYKLMGMAPYAHAEAATEAAAVFASMLEWESGEALGWKRKAGIPGSFYCYGWLRERLEGFRFDAICGGVQMFVERHLTESVRRAICQTHIHKVALSGGIFMNVKANQAIAELPEVDALFVYPSCGDESNAMGAAYGLYRQLKKPSDPAIEPLGSIDWGTQADDASIRKAIESAGGEFNVHQPADIAAFAAERLAQGEIVARFAGRAEFGARALGNRSILAHPGIPGVVRKINDQIKSRDFWMPFACSILARRADDYIVNPKRIAAPYMMLTFAATGRAAEIEAGIHPYDRTCRPQIVDPEWNPEYHRLIEAFEQKTGTGALLNTSFNLHGEPIVNSSEDALDVLRRSGLRCLILGDWWIEKKTK